MDDIDILISNNNYDIVKSVELIKEFYHTKYLFIFGIEKLKIMNKMKEWIQKILSIILKDSSNIISYEDCINSSEIIKSMDFKKEYVTIFKYHRITLIIIIGFISPYNFKKVWWEFIRLGIRWK